MIPFTGDVIGRVLPEQRVGRGEQGLALRLYVLDAAALRQCKPGGHDERDMTKYIIGTFSALDTPMNPEAKGSRSLSAYLEGITYEQIQKERNEILNAQPEDIRRLADLVEAVLKKDSICVIGNENMIKESAGLFENVEKLI